jgi:hypothetical protein
LTLLGTTTKLRILLTAGITLLLVSNPALCASNSLTLTPFFQGMQLQGELFGMGLTTIPDYLLAPGIAFPYKRKPGFTEEIPFVDTFTINRVMGGYREDWLEKFGLLQGSLGRRSLDYVIRNPDGSLMFRPELIRERLSPYLSAGYKPADMTLTLDNIPWDLATPTGQPPAEGVWGRNTPPGNLQEWSTVVRHFAMDLKAYLGPAANQIGFETGVEFDEKASFDGTTDQFFQYYKTTADAIHSVLPGARFSPGEFTGIGTCPPTVRTCVYDTQDFLAFAAREHIVPSDVPRSLHSLVDRPNPWPTTAVKRAEVSYDRLPKLPEEIHQFGLLFEPFGRTEQSDPGPMQASWEFQTLVQLLEGPTPRRVYHWGGIIAVGKAEFLNGSGFLRLVLDHYLGRQVVPLQVATDTPADAPDQVVAIALTGAGAPALIVSSFSPMSTGILRNVTIDLPPSLWPNGSRIKFVAYPQSHNIFASIRADLASDGNLKPDFAACALCLGNPIVMASDEERARAMIARNWPRYHDEMERDLRWVPNTSTISISGDLLSVQLEANELIVIEPVTSSAP